MDPRIEAEIERRAREIWEIEGRPKGREQVHWERARTEILDRELRAGASLNDMGGDAPGSRGEYISSSTPESRGESSFALGEKIHVPGAPSASLPRRLWSALRRLFRR